MSPDERFAAGEHGYYVVEPPNLEQSPRPGVRAVRGPYRGWRLAVRECAELNATRRHRTPLELRLVGEPAPVPYDQAAHT